MSSANPNLTAAEVAALERSVHALADEQPLLSAKTTFTRSQIVIIVTTTIIVLGLFILIPLTIGIVVVAFATLIYLANMIDRLTLFATGISHSPEIHVTDEQAMALTDEELPRYTVFVPAFNESQIVERLIDGLGTIDYPREKLEIMLLLEADDAETVSIAQTALEDGLLGLDIVLVPPQEPRTKPKACNYGMSFATGEFVTIYDAEDFPEPLQLRRAVVAFSRLPEHVVCIQAKLSYHNDVQNLLTKWFTSEYDQWFGYMLPGLMRTGSPIPLGGTSNHMRLAALWDVGGWDPYNVTEDADLGVRLFRRGYRTAILSSVTLEEANSDPINWLRQRSRWYKGYLQTFLVHTREPIKLFQELGPMGVLRFCVITAGTPVTSVINLFFWSLALAWELGKPEFIRRLFPSWTFYPAMTSLVFGNSLMIYCGMVSTRLDKKPRLLIACLCIPAYWILMSIAAIKAFIQLVFQPSYWEKTAHGLDKKP